MRDAVMNKYESAKKLKLTKARSAWTCETCGAAIDKGTEYFRESLGPIAKPPGLHLGSYCIACGKAKTRDLA
jgi:PHP family Zn ribbon phosphoesterase